jgi:hypothetical protein
MHFDPAGSHADDPEADTTIHFDPSRVNPYESAKLTKIPLKSSRPKPPFTLKLNTTTAILLGVGLFLAWQMMTGGFPFGRSNPFDGDDED